MSLKILLRRLSLPPDGSPLQTVPQPHLLSKIPLRLILIVPFVLQVSVAVGLVGFLSFKNGQKAVNNLAKQLMNEVSLRVDQHLTSYLSAAQHVNHINRSAIEADLIDIRDFERTGKYFWKQLQVYDFAYINLGNEANEFIGAGYVNGALEIAESSQPHIGTLYAYTPDVQGNRIYPPAHIYKDTNPNVDAWYTNAVAAGKPTWSSIYAWEGVGNTLAISASAPIYTKSGKLLAVTGIDLSIAKIDRFLSSLQVGKGGKILIVERSGTLVARSGTEASYKIVQGQAQRLQAIDSRDRLTQDTMQYLGKQFRDFKTIRDSQQLAFEIEGQRRFVQVTPYRDRFGLDWLIIVVIPEADFMQQVDENNRVTVLLCMLALFATVLLGIFTSRWIAGPIMQLSIASETIAQGARNANANGELNQEINVGGAKELKTLAVSFNHMAQQLKASFNELEHNNLELEQRVDQRTTELRLSEVQLQVQAQHLEQTLYELQQTQVQIVQSEKMSSLGQLVAGVAHEINNPVNFIYGNLVYADEYVRELLELVQLYQQHYPNPPDALQARLQTIDLEFLQADLLKLFGSMNVGTTRIREIVKSLRNFSRLDESEVKRVDIHEGIDSTLIILHHRLKSDKFPFSEIAIVKEYGSLPIVECYPGPLNQVFMNLLANAIDALEEHTSVEQGDGKSALLPTITISTTAETDWVTIHIADNGPGIDATVQSRLFDPFFTTKPVGQGTGLGLSISYQIIVEKHGGRISCHSAPMQGAEFVIEIPTQQQSSG